VIRDDLFKHYAACADFIQAYIFPGGMLVSEPEFRRLAAERGMDWRDQACFGPDYAETLRLWREAFDLAVREARLPTGFDDRFVRLWRFYLIYCEAGFRGGGIDVRQITLVKAA
jgi:cyclopropane-fatty-acyl-phospholipid synthase